MNNHPGGDQFHFSQRKINIATPTRRTCRPTIRCSSLSPESPSEIVVSNILHHASAGAVPDVSYVTPGWIWTASFSNVGLRCCSFWNEDDTVRFPARSKKHVKRKAISFRDSFIFHTLPFAPSVASMLRYLLRHWTTIELYRVASDMPQSSLDNQLMWDKFLRTIHWGNWRALFCSRVCW